MDGNIFSKLSELVDIIISSIKKFYLINWHNLLNKINKKVNFWKSYSTNVDTSKLPYEDLTPKDNANTLNSYFDALDWAMSNDKIFNIALTGTYGSGKSSVLKTYQKQRPHNNYLDISLATFCENTETTHPSVPKNGEPQHNHEQDDYIIEKSILQQLFYKVDSSKIPFTRFKKIDALKKATIVKELFVILFLAILGIILFYPQIIDVIIKNANIINESVYNLIDYDLGNLTYILYFLFSILAIYKVASVVKLCNGKLKLNKISFEKATIEQNNSNDESIFNKYLDEILYFFKMTTYSVVFIEDLDRFNNTKIFTKLRELNSLINNNEEITRKIVFIYAIKDEMFESCDRTKFFDFIIPVIPVINNTNSADKLLSKIRNIETHEDISDEFIKEISVYIDDMRTLNNIFNEYVLYRNTLTNVSLKPQQIMALIIYKNLYPKDFADLTYEKGIIYSAFDNKKSYTKQIIANLNEQIQELQKRIEISKAETIEKTAELKSVFIYSLLSTTNLKITELNSITNTKDQKSYSIQAIMKDDFDWSLLGNENLSITYTTNGYGNRKISSTVNAANNDFSKRTYIDRFNDIALKNDEQQKSAKSKIKQLTNDIEQMNSYSLKSLIDKFGINIILLDEKIKANKPLLYLLRNGYIDETYPNYLTYFYPNSLSALDMNFILSIRNHEPYDFSYELSNPKEIIHRLNNYEFEQIEILNFNLLDYLLENQDSYKIQLSKVFKTLENETPQSINFIDKYRNKSEHKDIFIKMVCQKWPNIWKFLIEKSNYPDDQIASYFKQIIVYIDIKTIKSIDQDNIFSSYIVTHPDIFSSFCSELTLEKSTEIISEFNVIFDSIESFTTNQSLFNFICENGFYIININNIKTIVENNKPELLNDLSISNFKTIKLMNYSPLLKYIENNFEEYIKNVFLATVTNINEDINDIIEILNNDCLSEELKEKVVFKEEFELQSLDVVPKNIWPIVIKHKKIVPIWDNVFTYFKEKNAFDNILISYLNNEEIYKKLSTNKFSKNDQDLCINFTKLLISSNISTTALKNLIKSSPYNYNNFTISGLSPEKVDILIESDFLKFTPDNYSHLKELLPKNHIKFIKKYSADYINNFDNYEVNNEDINDIFNLSCYTNEQKFLLVSKINIDNIDEKLTKAIINIFIDESIRDSLPLSLFDKLWNSQTINMKILLLSKQVKSLDESKVTNYVKKLGEPFSAIAEHGRKPQFDYNPEVLKLAKALDNCDYISSYSIIPAKGTRKVKKIQFNTYAG
ncbi:MAG: hypothetical protein AB9858_04665 [Acidaminococcaceae bacterium]